MNSITACRAHAREIAHHTSALDQRERDYPNALALLRRVNDVYILAGEKRGWTHETTVSLDALAADLNGLLDGGEPDISAGYALTLLRAVETLRALLVECGRRERA